jgi:acyl-CoA thioester hydrolase
VSNATRNPFFTHSLPIRWRDIDPYGHVNHSVYFIYMEEARLHWYRSLRLEMNVDFITPIVSADIQYKKALYCPGDVLIKLFCHETTKKTCTIQHDISRAEDPDTVYATSKIKLVCVSPETDKIATFPKVFREQLECAL